MLKTVVKDGRYEIQIMTGSDGHITLLIQDTVVNRPVDYADARFSTYLQVDPPGIIEKYFKVTWEDKIATGIQKLQKRIAHLHSVPRVGLTKEEVANSVANKFATNIADK